MSNKHNGKQATEQQAQESVVETVATPEQDAAAETVETPVVEEPTPVPAPVVEKPAPAPVAAPKPAPAQAQPQAAKFSPTVTMAFSTIDEYIVAMAKQKPVTVEEGSRQQVKLFRAISTIINHSGDEFEAAFTTLLKLFEEHANGVFAETHLFRFFEVIQLQEADRKAFQRILNLIKLMGPVKSRQVARNQVDFARSLEFGFSEEGKQKVMAYFGK